MLGRKSSWFWLQGKANFEISDYFCQAVLKHTSSTTVILSKIGSSTLLFCPAMMERKFNIMFKLFCKRSPPHLEKHFHKEVFIFNHPLFHLCNIIMPRYLQFNITRISFSLIFAQSVASLEIKTWTLTSMTLFTFFGKICLKQL